jgi:putative aminopeptidase FrvX
VVAEVLATLEELGLETAIDDYGNIIARIPGAVDGTTPLALMAHMDHPGFEAISTEDGYLVAKALGGVPAASFRAGVPLLIVLGTGTRLLATWPVATASKATGKSWSN